MNCGLCGGSGAVLWLVSGGRKLVKCPDCGLRRTADFVEPEYAEEYFAGGNRYAERWDEFCALADKVVAVIQERKPGGDLLDIGAGAGALVAAAAKRGFRARGVERSNWAADFARKEKGLDVFSGRLDQAGLAAGSFDAVVVNHVLEHIEKPLDLLREAGALLKVDGVLAVGVPNAGSLMARLQGGAWRSLRPLEHRWHFTPATIVAMLEKTGFTVLSLAAAENYAAQGWGPRGLARRVVNALSELAGCSEAMLVIAVKKVG